MRVNTLESKTRSLKISRHLLIVLVFLFVSIMLWTFITIANTKNDTTLSPELIKLANPLNPTIDRAVLSELAQKEFIDPSEIDAFTIFKLVTTNNGNSQTVVPIDVDTTIENTRPTPSQAPAVPTSSPPPFETAI